MNTADAVLLEPAGTATRSEVFALTDEQIVGLAPGDAAGEEEAHGGADSAGDSAAALVELRPGEERGAATTVAEVPEWLAERMRDPHHGNAAKELWDGKQRLEAETAAYREAFATPADARALKELYPGGLAEAKSAAERARAMDEIDAAFFRGDAAARVQLAQQMLQQNPAAFREMVEAGMRLLKEGAAERANPRPEDAARNEAKAGQEAVSPEVVRAYGEFEKSANAELEKSVGGAIARAMEQALPNLRGNPQGTPLQERLALAVREEVEIALRNDPQLGEQVTRVLAGRQFGQAARAQVVRLIDARAQQLVPGAVKRVVGSWTQTTLAARGKRQSGPAEAATPPPPPTSREEKPPREKAALRASAVPGRARRLDYGRMSDEEILGM